MVGIESCHANYYQDRKFRIACAQVTTEAEVLTTTDKKNFVGCYEDHKPRAFRAGPSVVLPSLKVGARVKANYKGKGRFYFGKIAHVNRDGTYSIHYDDGDK